MGRPRYEYLLGDSPVERARLRRQAALWDPTSHALFDRLRVRPGLRVLEIGPGQGSLHLELRRRLKGPADAVERSPVFAARLQARCRTDGLGAGSIWQCDLAAAPLPAGHYDLIFARWVLLFLPNPLGHLRQLARALKPGGRLAIQDYLRDTFSMIPRPPEWEAFIQADRAFFASQGGDVNIGARLPLLVDRAGLALEEARPNLKLGAPGSPTWRWMTDYFLGVMDRYATFAPFTPGAARRLTAHWKAAERRETSLLLSPTVVDVVARRPRSALGRRRSG